MTIIEDLETFVKELNEEKKKNEELDAFISTILFGSPEEVNDAFEGTFNNLARIESELRGDLN